MPCLVGTTQTSHTLLTVEPIVRSRIKESSVAVVSSDNLHALALLTNLHPPSTLFSVEPPLPHITNPIPLLTHLPNNTLFYWAQTPKVLRSAPYVLDETFAKSANATQRTSGMAQRPGAGKTIRDDSSPQPAPSCAMIGIPVKAAPPLPVVKDMNALGVEKRIMVLKDVLEHRKKILLTSYKFESWDRLLF